MYLERAEDYDKKMTGRWKADADGILVFVSALEPGADLIVHSESCLNPKIIDWSVFCRSRHIYWSLYPGSQAKLSGYLGILSCEYLSGTR